MKKSAVILLALALISTLLFVGWGVVRTVKAVSFDFNCEVYLKRAADSNTVEMAKENLEKAIEYAEANNLTEGTVSIFFKNPKNDVGFWFKNIKDAYTELDSLPEDTTPLEKTNVLMKLRESLTDEGDDGIEVTHPNGISIYPNNIAYFWWGIISLIASIIFWFAFMCDVSEPNYGD